MPQLSLLTDFSMYKYSDSEYEILWYTRPIWKIQPCANNKSTIVIILVCSCYLVLSKQLDEQLVSWCLTLYIPGLPEFHFDRNVSKMSFLPSSYFKLYYISYDTCYVAMIQDNYAIVTKHHDQVQI